MCSASCVVSQLIAAIPALLIGVPLTAVADSVDLDVIALAGEMVASIITAPLVAIVTTLLFYDLLTRREEVLAQRV